ncbi:MAG: amidohydrolase [Lachnospiraceae bacterium]|nr:amidohydrolase [Lachnospiraceae bacterium]
MKTIIINGIVITMNKEMDWYPEGYVILEGSKICQAGPMEEIRDRLPELKAEGSRIEDARRAIVMPGMVNTHCHLGMIPFRGLGDDCKDRLRVFLLPMEQKAMDEEMAKLSSQYAICELLLAGVTTVFDMYYFEHAVAAAMDELGIRGIAGQTVMEEGACDFREVKDAVCYGEALMKKYQNHPRVSACLAPHGTTTCSMETLKLVHEKNKQYHAPFTLHTAEMDYEMRYLRETYNCTPIEFLDRIGVLDEHTVAAHGIQMTEADIRLLKSRGASVAHCIASNTKAAKGVAPVPQMLSHGVAVGLGTDGPASGNTLDIFTQMRFCANFHKNESRNRSAMPAKDIVAMATIGGAKALGLDAVTGSIEAGKEADLVLAETDSPNMFPVYDPYSALVYSANSSNVRDVYVAGKQLVKDKKLVYADDYDIRRKLREKMGRSSFGEMRFL